MFSSSDLHHLLHFFISIETECLHAFSSCFTGNILLTSLIQDCREWWHRKLVEINTNKQTSKATACTKPLLSHLSSEGAGWWLGSTGGGSLCVCLHIIFRAGYQQCQHENKPVAARKCSHDTSTANSGGTNRILWQQQDSFLHFVSTVGFEHGLRQLERNFHPAVSDGATFCHLSRAGKSCVSTDKIHCLFCDQYVFGYFVVDILKRQQMHHHMLRMKRVFFFFLNRYCPVCFFLIKCIGLGWYYKVNIFLQMYFTQFRVFTSVTPPKIRYFVLHINGTVQSKSICKLRVFFSKTKAVTFPGLASNITLL